jgi:hypothetical protein
MLAGQRQEAIFGPVDRTGAVRVGELVATLSLSTVPTLDPVDVLVTTTGPDARDRRIITEHVGQLIVAQLGDIETDKKSGKVPRS